LRIRFRGNNAGQLLCDSLTDSIICALKESAMESIGRNPEAASKILVPMLLASAFTEAVAIYGLVIAFSIK
jgi:F0F1-type ATP synthase membrane subunit c/vacuolar-type H+-ATPase subunit K